jgi:phage baseplate assembly protein W
MAGSHLDHPLHLDGTGRVATTDADDHVRDMIEQVLFTSPGERVNRPDFGCGLLQLVFMPNRDVLATATQLIVQGALQRWLADVIQVDQVRITVEEERLLVDVGYTRLDTGQRLQDRFSPGQGG